MSELFTEIKRLPVSKEIMNQLRESILAGKIKIGEKIPSERELTERFHVSRNMVREAIRGLETLGYLEIHQGARGGAFVKDFTHDRLSNVFLDFYLADRLTVIDLVQARLLIEPEVTQLAAKTITRQGSLLLLEAEKSECFKENHSERMENLAAVHCVLAEICGNTFYGIMVNALIAITQEIVLNTLELGIDEPLHGYGQHKEIVGAVIEGDSKKSKKLMAEHLKDFLDALSSHDKKYRNKQSV